MPQRGMSTPKPETMPSQQEGVSKHIAQVRMQSWWLARRPSGYGQQSFIDSHGLEFRGVNVSVFEAQGLGIMFSASNLGYTWIIPGMINRTYIERFFLLVEHGHHILTYISVAVGSV